LPGFRDHLAAMDDGKTNSANSATVKTWQDELIEDLRKMSTKELFEIAVAAGIYTSDGKLTPHYTS
jgi:hypothetical protein